MSGKNRPVLVAVYYRDFPHALELFIAGDDGMSFTKDGVQHGCGHSCPRMTIMIKSINPQADKDRLKKLYSLLALLEHNNQLVSFSLQKN